VSELIWVTVDPATCVPNPAMTGLAQHLVGQVMALRPRFSVALRKAIAGARGVVEGVGARARACMCMCVCGVVTCVCVCVGRQRACVQARRTVE
jgi:hypothetical protein